MVEQTNQNCQKIPEMIELMRTHGEMIRNNTVIFTEMYIKLTESQQKTEEQRRSHEKKLENLEIRFAESRAKTKAKYTELDIKVKESEHKTEEQRRNHEKKLEELEIRFAKSRAKTEAKYTELDIKVKESEHKTEEQRRSHEEKLENLEIRFVESRAKTEEQRRSYKKKLKELDIKVKESELRVNEMSLHTNHIYNQNMEINQLLNMNKNRPQSVPSGPLQPAPESPDLIPNVRAPNSSGYLGDQSRDEVHSKEKEELP